MGPKLQRKVDQAKRAIEEVFADVSEAPSDTVKALDVLIEIAREWRNAVAEHEHE